MGNPIGHLNQSLSRLFGFGFFAFEPGVIRRLGRIVINVQIEL
jgi:hypothetical protein